MTTRRTHILDAAIDVLGRQGVRALTHRAVDAAARLPAGTTSNYFRTRDSLFDAVVQRFVEREREAFAELAAASAPTTVQELAAVIAHFVVTATTERRELTLARFAILVEAAIQPRLRAPLSEGGAEVRRWATAWLRAVGSSDPERDLGVLANQADALTLHQLANPDPDFAPEPALVALLTAVVSADRSKR